MILHEEPASVGQRMVWLIDRHRGGAGRLNYPLFLRLRGPLEVDVLRRALDRLVARHESLRTTFARRRGLLTQLVHAAEPVPLRVVALHRDADGCLAEELRREATTSIDPSVSALRVTLWSAGDLDHVLCLNAHHLVTDAWSSRILTDELVQLLSDDGPLPRVAWQYRHFVRWQQRRTTAEQWRHDAEYWRTRLAGVRPPGPWRDDPQWAAETAHSAGADPGDAESGTLHMDLDGDLARRIDHLARTQQATRFAVLLAVFYQALHLASGESDLCVAAPFANRNRPESAGTVGLLANLVLLRTQVDTDGCFSEQLRRTRDTVNAAAAHQGYPYYLLPTDPGRPRPDRLDEVVFQMLPELPAAVRAGGLDIEVLVPQLHNRFDLELAAVPHARGLRVRLQYARGRVADGVGSRIAAGYRRALAESLR